MLRIEKKGGRDGPADDSVTLTFEQRSRSRLRAALDSGGEVAIALTRGSQLYPGDLLISDCGKVVAVKAAAEKLSVVEAGQSLLLAKACYHLGNRHVALQINDNTLCYQHDHVLDDMITGLGLSVRTAMLPFTPESGAYSDHAHVSGHSH